jgi:tetratricopeptide (TPR) repeat protein
MVCHSQTRANPGVFKIAVTNPAQALAYGAAPKYMTSQKQRSKPDRRPDRQRISYVRIGISAIVLMEVTLAVQINILDPVLEAAQAAVERSGRQAYRIRQILFRARWQAALPKDDKEVAIELLNEGEQLFQAGRVDEAIAAYKAAAEKNPDDEDIFYNLAIAYDRKGLTNNAIATYQQAIELFPEYAEAHNNLGNLLARCDRHQEAEEIFRKLIKFAPENAGARNNYGAMLGKLRRHAEAIVQFREAVRYDTNHLGARFNLSTALLSQRQFAEAITNLELIVAAKPDWDLARMKLQQARQLKAASEKQ